MTNDTDRVNSVEKLKNLIRIQKIILDNIPMLLNVNTLYDKNSKEQFFIATQIDVDQYRRAEKEINDLSEFSSNNPNPVFRVSSKLRIIYANEPAKILLRKIGLKGVKIPKKFFEKVTPLIKKKNENLKILEFKISNSIYEFSIIKVKDSDYYNIYGNDI